MDFLNAVRWALEHASEFNLPLFIQIGEMDHIVSVPAAESFAEKAPNCSYKEWPGLCHETHNEPQHDAVLQNMVDWLNARL